MLEFLQLEIDIQGDYESVFAIDPVISKHRDAAELNHSKRKRKDAARPAPKKVALSISRGDSCVLCSGQHQIDQCEKHTTKVERYKRAMESHLYFKCLASNHSFKNCKAHISRCGVCGYHHHADICKGGNTTFSKRRTEDNRSSQA